MSVEEILYAAKELEAENKRLKKEIALLLEQLRACQSFPGSPPDMMDREGDEEDDSEVTEKYLDGSCLFTVLAILVIVLLVIIYRVWSGT